MAAPMGNFSNYGHEPRAVLVIDRSLREHAPGNYETVSRLPRAGAYDLVFYLDSPRFAECFSVVVAPDPESPERQMRPVRIESASLQQITAGTPARVQVRIVNPATGELATASDVRVLVFLSPGAWQTRTGANPAGGGMYDIQFTPPEAGVYYIFFESPTLGLSFRNPQRITLIAAARNK
jgi:hypothetical protein